MEPVRARVLPGQRGVDGVAVVLAGADDPLDELRRMTVSDIDGWEKHEL